MAALSIVGQFQQVSHLDPWQCKCQIKNQLRWRAWSDPYGTKIVLKCYQILQFKHIQRKDEKKYQQGAN